MGLGHQLYLLLWKNYLLQRRKILVTFFEIFVPLFFAGIMLILRAAVKQVPVKNPTIFPKEFLYYPKIKYIMYTPNNTLISNIMKDVAELSFNPQMQVKVNISGFLNREAMEKHYKSLNTSHFFETQLFAVEFLNVKFSDTVIPKTVYVAFRPGTTTTLEWKTKLSYNEFQTNEPRYLGLTDYRTAFVFLQFAVSRLILIHWDSEMKSFFQSFRILYQRMPFPEYIKDPMLSIIKDQLPSFIVISLMIMVIQTTKGLVHEKETKLKESMKLMGMSSAAHWLSWIMSSMIIFFVTAVIYQLMCTMHIVKYGPVLPKTESSVFFFFLFCYGLSAISFACMISVFIQRANVAALVSAVVFFVSFVPYYSIKDKYPLMSKKEKLLYCLDFNIAMAFGMTPISALETAGIGAKWSNIFEPPSVDDNFTLIDASMMLMVDTVIFFVITWYVDNIWPGDYGVPQPWYFPVSSAYWSNKPYRERRHSILDDVYIDPKHFEAEPRGLKAGVKIDKLTKVFGSGFRRNVAVNNLSLTVFENQITALLGHNGAGKTTTMSLLTGFYTPTSGTALVNGYNISTQMPNVRKSLGLCTQHDILFDKLTVLEHLQFFASLKGVPKAQIKDVAQKMATEVGLQYKMTDYSMNLSGGQKRKLSVGIALIGGSKVVMLDEPTSGMDPASRRNTWDILQNHKKGRTMILTTHFMDEADVLGDRIAIMAKGVIKCCGTSMFLKKLYGTGYHMIVVKQKNCNVNTLTSAVKSIIPKAEMESEINTEVSYLLPDNQSHKFADLFRSIDQKKDALGINSFGASATTMEEVFIKVGEEAEYTGTAEEMKDRKAGLLEDVSEKNPFTAFRNMTKRKGFDLQLARFRALFVKKYLHTRRNLILGVSQTVIPVILTILAMLDKPEAVKKVDEPSMTLDLSRLGATIVPYSDGDGRADLPRTLAKNYYERITGDDTPEKVDREKYSNMSWYFLNKTHELGLGTFNRRVLIGVEFDKVKDSTLYSDYAVAYYNGQPLHSLPISIAYLMNSFSKKGHSIVTYNHPLPIKGKESHAFSFVLVMWTSFSVVTVIELGMGFLTASFVYFLIKERQVGAKHLQVVSGTGPLVFWMANLTWDYINYLIPCFMLIIVFFVFDMKALITGQALLAVTLLFLSYGYAIIPLMYLLQFLFISPATGLAVILILNVSVGFITPLISVIMSLIGEELIKTLESTNTMMTTLFPHYCFGKGLMDMCSNHMFKKMCRKMLLTAMCKYTENPCCPGNCGKFCFPFTDNQFQWKSPGIGRPLVFMLMQGSVFTLLVLVIDFSLIQRALYILGMLIGCFIPKRSQAQEEDSDVHHERRRINGTQIKELTKTDAVIIKNLYKRFGTFVSVDNICVGIPQNECFGLLGQNGAGKSTTFKMLTGEIMVTGGNAYLKGYGIRNNLQNVHQHMGYCPQFDALIGQMTGRETLYMYSRLKGIPEIHLEETANALIDIMLLTPHADKMTLEYSGGNMRKLSTAIALVGNPSFILLDEPSTGMDPMAKRQMWQVLSRVRSLGKTLILTSHSMEECDALCTRLAIMVNGRFRCLGSPQHLKTKFGQGYTLILQMNMLEKNQFASSSEVLKYIKGKFAGAKVFDDHQGYLHIQVPEQDVSIADIFSVMEKSKKEYNVKDYSVHQTTLEQVFLSFTREQIPPKEVSFMWALCPCLG